MQEKIHANPSYCPLHHCATSSDKKKWKENRQHERSSCPLCPAQIDHGFDDHLALTSAPVAEFPSFRAPLLSSRQMNYLDCSCQALLGQFECMDFSFSRQGFFFSFPQDSFLNVGFLEQDAQFIVPIDQLNTNQIAILNLKKEKEE